MITKKNKIYSLFIGRWQPLHDGHKKLIDTVLAEGKNVLIACRDTGIDKQNPYNLADRFKMIRKSYPDTERVRIISIPDIEEVVWGRGVGWGRREIKLDEEIEKISATKIREGKIEKN